MTSNYPYDSIIYEPNVNLSIGMKKVSGKWFLFIGITGHDAVTIPIKKKQAKALIKAGVCSRLEGYL